MTSYAMGYRPTGYAPTGNANAVLGGKGGGRMQPPQPMQPSQAMGGKGGGRMQPPQTPQPVQTGQAVGGKGGGQQIPSYMQPYVQNALRPRGTLVGIGPNDDEIYSNDPNAVPYTGPSMGGNYVNGVPVPRTYPANSPQQAPMSQAYQNFLNQQNMLKSGYQPQQASMSQPQGLASLAGALGNLGFFK